MPNEGIDIPIRGRNETDAAFNAVNRNVNQLKANAAEANVEMAALGRTSITPTVSIAVEGDAIATTKARIAELKDQIASNIVMGVDTTKAVRELGVLQRAFKAISKEEGIPPVPKNTLDSYASLESQLKSLGSLQPGLSRIFGSAGVLVGTGLVASNAIKAASGLEQLTVQLSTLVGSHDKAQQIVTDLRDLSAHSTLKFDDLVTAARTLAAFGVQADKIASSVADIGEAASATGQPVADLALIWGQMVSFGSVDVQDMRQFMQRGVKFWEALAQGMGVTVEQAKELSKQGKIGAADIQKLITGLGDVYKGDTALMAQTFQGQVNILTSNVTKLQQRVGEGLIPVLKVMMSDFNSLITSGAAPFFETLAINMGIAFGVSKLFGTQLREIKLALMDIGRETIAQGTIAGISLAFTKLRTGIKGVIDALGGPWAVAIMGAITVLETFAGGSADAANATKDMTDQLIFQNGVLDQNSYKLAAKDLQDKGILKTINLYGLSSRDAIRGLGNDTEARNRFIQSIQLTISSLEEEQRALGRAANDRKLTADQQRASVSRQQEINSLKDALTAYRDLTGAADQSAAEQQAVAEASGTVGEQAISAAGAINAQAGATNNLLDAVKNLKGVGNEDVSMFERWTGGLTVLIPVTATAAQETEILNGALDDQAKKLQSTQSTLDTYINSFGKLHNVLIDVTTAHIDFESAIDKLYSDIEGAPAKVEEVKKKIGRKVITVQVVTQAAGPQKLGLDIDTEQGRTNVQNLIAAAEAAQNVAEKNIAAGRSKDEVLKQYDLERDKILKATELLGHFNKAQAEAFLKANVPLETHAEMSAEWDHDNIDGLKKQIEELKKPIHIKIYLEPHPTMQQVADEITAIFNKDIAPFLGKPITPPVQPKLDPEAMHDAKHKAEEIGLEGGGIKIPVGFDLKAFEASEALLLIDVQKFANAAAGKGFVPNSALPGGGASTGGRSTSEQFEAVNRALVGTPVVTETNAMPTMPAAGLPSTVVNPQQTVVNVHVNDQRYKDLLDVQISNMVGSVVRKVGSRRVVTAG